MERLEAFESMMKTVFEQSEAEKNRMVELKMQGKEKSATYRQYMDNRYLTDAYPQPEDTSRKESL